MRVLLATIASRRDVQPLVALALQLTAFGQQVRLFVPPDFQDWIDSLGTHCTAERRQGERNLSPELLLSCKTSVTIVEPVSLPSLGLP